MYTVYENHVLVTGKGWYNQPIINKISLRAIDIENLKSAIEQGAAPRAAVESWLDCHSGNFQSIDDFSAVIDKLKIELPFGNPDSELDFYAMEL